MLRPSVVFDQMVHSSSSERVTTRKVIAVKDAATHATTWRTSGRPVCGCRSLQRYCRIAWRPTSRIGFAQSMHAWSFGKASHHSGTMRPTLWEDTWRSSFQPSLGGGQLDEYWNNLVLGVIGGTVELADVITGVRLVNVYVGYGSNLQTRSGMTWKGVSLAGTQWSRWQLWSCTLVWRSSRRAVLEKFAPHREEQCWIRSVTRVPQPTRHVALTPDRVHFSAGKKRKTSSREWMWT